MSSKSKQKSSESSSDFSNHGEEKHKHLAIDDAVGILGWWGVFLIYWSYAIGLLSGYIADKWNRTLARLGLRDFPNRAPEGYAPLTSDVDYFWLHYFYQNMRDCFERPINTTPGAYFDIMERYSDDRNASFK